MVEEKPLGITTKKSEDIAEWYSQVCQKAELADYSTISGFMIIRPRGYAVWENIQKYFNKILKKYNVPNSYFPLLIPESFFRKEASHVAGFEPELAWVQRKGETERLAIRPTSETIMYDSFAKWIRSYRDLPFRINQWCNVVRWEVKSTKLFLRSREFLWHEAHCVYETEEEADKEAKIYLEEYKKLCEDLFAIPVMCGIKTEKERFPGAKETYTIEAFMPDGKAIQCGTSHNLGQGFSKAFDIKFIGKDEKEHNPWQNSWGFSTRLIGAMTLLHGDDKGLVLPPKIAPLQVVIIPILFEKTKDSVLDKCKEIKEKLKDFTVEIDDRDFCTPGWKFNEHELKGVPLRIEIGPKDLENKQAVLVRRDTNTKKIVKESEIKKEVEALLDTIQKSLFINAKRFLDGSIVEVDNWKDFLKEVKNNKIVYAPFCGKVDCEDLIKHETQGITTRCIPLDAKKIDSKCVKCKKKAEYKIYFSRSY